MTIYILNKQDGSQSIDEFQNIPSEIILWQGTKEEFEKLNIKESQLGGLELKNGKLVFNQDKWNKVQKQKLPIATGKGLIAFIEKAFLVKPTGMTDREHWNLRKQLQSLFTNSGIKTTLESETCNPTLSIVDFHNVMEDIQELSSSLTLEQIILFKNLLTDFVNQYKFVDFNKEELNMLTKKLAS